MLDSVLGTAYAQLAGDTAKKDKMAEYKPQVVQAVTQAVVQQVTQQVTSGVTASVIGQQSATMAAQTGGVLNAEAVAAICAAVNEAVNTEGSDAQNQINALIAQQNIDGMVASNVDARATAAPTVSFAPSAIPATICAAVLSIPAFSVSLAIAVLTVCSTRVSDGTSKLSGAAMQIKEGVDKLSDGSDKLKDGIIKFDKDAIQKLTDAYDGDVKTLLNKLEAVAITSSVF